MLRSRTHRRHHRRTPRAKPGPGTPRRTRSEQPELTTVTVTGVRESQIRAIEVKRLAPSIQDSISAESIGQLPDVTITDALQRITGVQINRDAGVGTSVDVRGLPQVGTMLNGEVFITPDQIDSQQPDFTTLPATLFNQVDVIKSPTAAQTESGISGALDLHTYRPWDLPHGFTYSYSRRRGTGQTPRARLGRRQAASSHTTPMVAGVCRFPVITPTPRGRNVNRGPRPVRRHPPWRERGKRGGLQRLPGGVERRADSFPDHAESGRQCRCER